MIPDNLPIGTKVRAIEGCGSSLTRGSIYTVAGYRNENRGLVLLEGFAPTHGGFYLRRFEVFRRADGSDYQLLHDVDLQSPVVKPLTTRRPS